MKNAGPTPLRGSVWLVDYPQIGVKPAVVVSNNGRNKALHSILAIRISTAPKPDLPSIVQIPTGEPVVGRVLCDEVSEIQKAWLIRNVGGLSVRTMLRVNDGLRVALSLLHPK